MDRQLRGYLVKVLAATMALLCPFAVGVVIVDRVSVSILVIAWTLSVLAFRPNLATSVTPKLVRLFLMACLAITLFDLVSRPVLVKPLWVRATAMFEHPWPPMPLVHRCVANLRYRGREYGDLATVTGVKTDREEREVTFSTDAHGFRNELSGAGQPRPLDVILLGGSMPDGANTTQEDILSSLLLRDYGYQTYNLSMGASRPWENYVNLALEIDRLPIKPQRTVVLWVLVADIRELDEPCHRNLDTAKLPWNDWLGSLMVSYQTLRRYSPVHQFISRAVIRLRYGRLARESWVLRRNFLDGRMLLFASRDPAPKDRTAEDLLHHPNFPCFRATFSAMKRLADQKNLKVAIVLVPNKAGVYSWVLDNGPPWSTTLDPSDFSIVLKQISEQEGFYFFDLKPFFVEASRRAWEDSRGVIWWHDDMHWNARGHKEAASVIYSKVLRQLLPDR